MLGPVISKSLFRPFASSTAQVLPTVEKLADKFTLQSLDSYKQNKVDVDKHLDKVCFHFADTSYICSAVLHFQ